MIPKAQDGETEAATGTWKIVSGGANPFLQYGTLMLVIARTESRSVEFYLLTQIVVVGIFDNVMKYSYAAPRPYWVNDDVVGLTCSTDFGNPSSHVLVLTSLSSSLWLLFVDKRDGDADLEDE